DTGLWQSVPVHPGSHYEASFFVKANELESASGPRFIVQDSNDGSILGKSEESMDSTGWREQRISFQTGPSTQMVALRLVSEQPEKLIHGRLWVDDVKLQQRCPR